MKKRIGSFLLAVLMVLTLVPKMKVEAAGRYEVKNSNSVTGEDIVAEARKWKNVGATYWSGITPWESSIYWRTGYAYQGQTSFDCSGFVGRILNDCGFRSTNYTPSYGTCVLSSTYGSGYIGISIEELVSYGTDITSSVKKAKNGDFSELLPGDIIGWTSSNRHVIIYAGMKNGVPWMVEFTGYGYQDRAVTDEYKKRFEYGARLVNEAAEDSVVEAESADFVSRSDGVWLFPLDKSYYNCFSDWAGCAGYANCPFHGYYHEGWGDPEHNNSSNANGHNGIDISANGIYQEPVYAAADGIAHVEYSNARGNYVIIEHPIGDGWSYFSYYQHLDSATISDGAKVNAGDTIGKVGKTGEGSGIHLHFGIVIGHNKSYEQLSAMEGGETEKGWVLTEGLHEGKILVNPAFNSPAGFPTGNSAVVPPLKAHAGSVMYTFNKSEVNIGENSAADECEEIYPSWCELEITSGGAYVKSLPCSEKTNPDSENVERAEENAHYIASGICLNSAGNYWYRVTAKNGETGYIYSGDTTLVGRKWPYVSGSIMPDSITGATYLGGTIITGGSKIESVCAYVYKGSIVSGSPILKSDVDVVGSTGNYNLEKSGVDYSMPFQDLENYGDGYYTIAIEVDVTNYYLTSDNELVSDDSKISKVTVAGQDTFAYGSPSCSHSNYKSTVTAPTCTEGGYTTYTCTNCGYSYTGNETAATGHSFGEWYVHTAATCVSKGEERRDCANCDHYESRETELTDHSYSDYWVVIAPTLESEGVLNTTCAVCSSSKGVGLPALSEKDYTYTVVKEPTFEEEGVGRYTWKVTEYGTFSFDVAIAKVEVKITGIQVWTLPKKTVYEVGEELDTTGLSILVLYNDGVNVPVDSDFSISGFDSATPGEKTVTVNYMGFTDTFTVTVNEPQQADPNAPAVVVSGGQARAGETVAVTVAVKNNPGIASMKLKVSFDQTVMTLTEVVYNSEIGGQFTQPQSKNSPVTLNWVSAFADAEGDWTFATLTFAVSEDAEAGNYPILVTYDPDDVYDLSENNVEFYVENGFVNVVDYIPGDINGDGKVNNKDATRLLQYLSEWDVEVVEAALDVNGDGKVNNKDATRLLQYLSEWDVEIH